MLILMESFHLKVLVKTLIKILKQFIQMLKMNLMI